MRRIALLLTVAIGTAALLAFFYPGMMVNAAEVAMDVQGEDFTPQPPGTTGTSVVTDTTLYSNGQALKFSQDVMASHSSVTCTEVCDVEVLARGGQTGGSPTLSVNGSTPQTITNNGPPEAYLFNDVDLPADSPNTISITAGNTGTGHNLFVDLVSFPASEGSATDTTPPIVTIDSGPGDTSDGAATFTFSANEPATFECKLLRGTTTISNWATCTSTSTSGKTYSGLADGDYRFRVRGTDSSNNVSVISSLNFTVTNGGGGGGGSEFIVGAGDISSGGSGDQETGDLVRAQLSAGAWGVFTTGDNAYPDGTNENYLVYDAAWGSFKEETRPVFGNHDYYGDLSAKGANTYWNESPAVPVPGGFTNSNSYYYYDIPNTNWRGIVLNSASSEGPKGNQAPPCTDGTNGTVISDQMKFLSNALNTTKHTVLFWHHARFSASTDHPTTQGATGCSDTFFDEAHDNGADLVVQGHSHVYERYDTRDKDGNRVAGGLTSIVCGTGGNSSDGLQGSPSPTPDVKFTNTWGVCKLTLNTNNAEVRYLEAPNSPGAPVDFATVAVRP
jgi:hypothetical protein